MALTRFKDARKGEDGPVSGAVQALPVVFASGATNTAYSAEVTFPAGMGFEITDIVASAKAVTSDPSITIGDTLAGTQVVAAVDLTTALGALTIKDGTIDAGGRISVTITNDTGDAFTGACINIVGYPVSPPTSILQDDRGGAKGY